VFDDYVFVIDANFPWGAREILPDIRKTTQKPIRFVFDTHYHADHASGNGVFAAAGAALVSTEECAEESRRKGAQDFANQAKGRPEAAADPLVHPSVLFDRRMVFDDGRHRVELTRLGPAHTKGDAVAYLPRESILFVGDLAVNWTRGNNLSDPGADYANWVRALDQLASWKARAVIPSHGEIGTVETLTGQRGYLAEMLSRVELGMREGKPADDLAQSIDLSRRRPRGEDPARTAAQVRTMYRGLARPR
jgi:cyclase